MCIKATHNKLKVKTQKKCYEVLVNLSRNLKTTTTHSVLQTL